MAIPADELSAFFDHIYSDLRKDWELRVDQGSLSDWTKQRHQIRMDEIGMILRVLSEGHAVLTYQKLEDREMTSMIWVPRTREG